MSSVDEIVKNVISQLNIVDINQINSESNLFDAGMTSHASVKLMLALEDKFDIEFPDEMLQREFFSSICAIGHCVARITESR